MNQTQQNLQHITRRHFLRQGQMGLGAVALGALMNRDGLAAPVLDVEDFARVEIAKRGEEISSPTGDCPLIY